MFGLGIIVGILLSGAMIWMFQLVTERHRRATSPVEQAFQDIDALFAPVEEAQAKAASAKDRNKYPLSDDALTYLREKSRGRSTQREDADD